MQTGISTASLFGRRQTEDALKYIKDSGAACAEVFLSTFYEYRPEFSKKIAPLAQGLQISSLHSLPTDFEPHLFNPSARVRGDGFYWLDQVLRSAQLLGCKNYVMHGFVRAAVQGENEDAVADCLQSVCEFCNRYGVNLCLENVSWSTCCKPGVFGRLKARLPSLSGVFDIKQARRSGYPWQAYLADMQGAISIAHLSDIDEDGKICLPGKGITDFGEVFSRLKDAGFDGTALIEVYGGNYGDEGELSHSLEFINETAAKIF